MRYVVDENNYVKAISFGTIMEYNECVCVEYTGSVPSGWNDLEAWYFDEGNKLWRWQIVDGELVTDESAVPPDEGSWLGPDMYEAVKFTGDNKTTLEVTLPGGTDKLAGFFMYLSDGTLTNEFSTSRALSMYVSVLESRIDTVYYSGDRPTYKEGDYSGLTLDGDVVKFDLYKIHRGMVYFVAREYTIYPFYLK